MILLDEEVPAFMICLFNIVLCTCVYKFNHPIKVLVQGKAIEAQIPQRWIGTCRPRLKEDSVYYIKFFQVVSAKTSFCTVDHAYMIRFTGHTQITEIKLVPVAFPLYACTPVPFSVLHDRLHITEYTSGIAYNIYCNTQLSLLCIPTNL